MGSTVAVGLNPVTVGIDVGQVNDPTAICVCEVSSYDTGKIRYRGKQTMGRYDPKGDWIPPRGTESVMRSKYTVRHIARLPLGTSYPDVSIALADMLCSPMFANRNVRVLIDATAVGKPVYEMLKKEIALRPQCKHIRLKPITFSGGEKYNRKTGVMAKKFLVSGLQSLLQEKRIDGPDTPEMKVTVEELRVYEIKVGDEGRSTYGAKKGKHDDLATALGLSCLEDPFSEKISYSGRIY